MKDIVIGGFARQLVGHLDNSVDNVLPNYRPGLVMAQPELIITNLMVLPLRLLHRLD